MTNTNIEKHVPTHNEILNDFYELLNNSSQYDDYEVQRLNYDTLFQNDFIF